MKRSLTISCIAHVVALALALIAISAEPNAAPPMPSLPVSFISDKDFTQITQGVKNPPKLKIEDPKPLADKIDQPKPVDQAAPKVADRAEIKTETAPAKTPPKIDPNKIDPKPAADKPDKPKIDPKPVADKPDKPKAPDYRPDQIAQLLKKDQPKPTPETKPTPDKAAEDARKFDASQVAALLDHRDPQRQTATADAINDQPNLGASTGAAAQLSQSEIDSLRARISQCWSPPAGVEANSKLYIVLRVLFKPDGSLSQDPVVVEGSPSALGPALAESGKRALLLCQPFTMLRPEHYDQWKDLELKFDPHELLGG
jgi:colicin import membrane protein